MVNTVSALKGKVDNMLNVIIEENSKNEPKVIKIKKMKGDQGDRVEKSCVYLLPWAYKIYNYL